MKLWGRSDPDATRIQTLGTGKTKTQSGYAGETDEIAKSFLNSLARTQIGNPQRPGEPTFVGIDPKASEQFNKLSKSKSVFSVALSSLLVPGGGYFFLGSVVLGALFLGLGIIS